MRASIRHAARYAGRQCFGPAWLVVLFGGLLITLGGCQEQPGNALRFGLSSAPVTLDPRFATDAASGRVNRLLYDRLVDFDQHFAAQPAIAHWRFESPTRVRFELVGVHHFQTGERLGARDVKATYDSILDAATGSPHRGSLDMVSAVEIVGERTVRFLLSRPDPLFPGRLTIGILPASLLETGHAFARQPVGSGAFEFVDWAQEGRLRLRRRADGQEVEFLRVAKPTVRVLKLLRGEIDMLQGDVPRELVAWLEKRDDVHVLKQRGTNFAYLGFNLEDRLTGDLDLRRAIAHAVDRAAIIKYVLGSAARAASSILPPDHWAGHPGLPTLAYDPDKSRAILREAGLVGDAAPTLVYKTSSDPFRVRLATIIQHQLTEVGLPVELRSYDWGTFYGDVKAGRFQMYSLAWVGVKLPDIFRYTMHSSSIPPVGANRGRFVNSRADALIEQAERAPEREEQAQNYRELQELLLEQLPYVPLWFEDQVFVSRRDIRGFKVARDGNYDGLKTAWRESTQ